MTFDDRVLDIDISPRPARGGVTGALRALRMSRKLSRCPDTKMPNRIVLTLPGSQVAGPLRR